MLYVARMSCSDLQHFNEKRCTTVHSRKLNRCLQSGQSQPPLAHVITFLGTKEMDAHFKTDQLHFTGWGWDKNLLRKLSSVHLLHAFKMRLLARPYLSEHCFQALNFSSLSLVRAADIQGDDLMWPKGAKSNTLITAAYCWCELSTLARYTTTGD